MKKILAALLICVMVFGTSISVFASGSKGAISRGEFTNEVVNFFGWPHWDSYNDVWKDDPRTFSDIAGNEYQRAIETAFEEGVVGPADFKATRSDGKYGDPNQPNMAGNFRPDAALTREEAAVILARAYKLDTGDIAHGYTDTNAFSNDEARGSVAALAKLGLFGTVGGSFRPHAAIGRDEALSLFQAMKDGVVAPAYFLPRATSAGYAPRRNVKIYTANPAAELYVNRGTDAAEAIAAPVPGTASQRYIDVEVNSNTGYLGYATSGQTPTIKAVAVDPTKTLMSTSEVAQETWTLYRPSKAPFEVKEIFAKGELSPGSPRVVRLMNEEGQFAPMAWYIEGSEKAIMYESLQTSTGNTEGDTLRDLIVNQVASAHIAANPYENLYYVAGHNHPDHVAQANTFEGHYAYSSPLYNLGGSWSDENKERLIDLLDGDTIDLGDTLMYAYPLPGHENALMTLQHKESGMVFATDVYGCTRVGTADDVAVSGVKSDMMLSLIQQTHSKYLSGGGAMNYLFTGHDESTLHEENFLLYEEAFQLLIDEGYATTTHASHRQARIGANTRTMTIGNLYPDLPNGKMIDPTMTQSRLSALNATDEAEATPAVEIPEYRKYRGATEWVSITFGGPAVGSNAAPNYLSSGSDWSRIPTGVNYNTENAENGAVTYSQLSNIEFEGAELVGVDFQWGSNAGYVIPNMFHPWVYDYTIKVPEDSDTVSVIPTTMTTNATSIKVNGKSVDYKSSTLVAAEQGAVITVEVVAPDGETTSTYNFTVTKGTPAVSLTADKRVVKSGDEITFTTIFNELTASNVAVLTYTYDSSLFDLVGYTAAEGTTELEKATEDGTVKATIMIQDYQAENLGNLVLTAKTDLPNATEQVGVTVEYVQKDELEEKTIQLAEATATLYKFQIDPNNVSLLDLSNLIDYFGADAANPEWDTFCVFYDFNGNKTIDIHDISTLSRMIVSQTTPPIDNQSE